MKKVISILMVAMLFVCGGAFSALAAEDTTGADVSPGLTLLRNEMWEDHSYYNSKNEPVPKIVIDGDIQNNTGERLFAIYFKYRIVDANGNYVQDVSAQIRDIKPGEIRRFVCSPYPDVPGYTPILVSIKR